MRVVFALVILVGLGAVVGAIVIGNRTFDGLVVDEPYEKGLAWDAIRRAQEESGLVLHLEPAAFVTGSHEIVARIESPSGPLRGAQVALLVTRPHTTAEDERPAVSAAPDGSYRAEVTFGSPGAWELAYTVTGAGVPIEIRRRIRVEEPEPSPAGGSSPSPTG